MAMVIVLLFIYALNKQNKEKTIAKQLSFCLSVIYFLSLEANQKSSYQSLQASHLRD